MPSVSIASRGAANLRMKFKPGLVGAPGLPGPPGGYPNWTSFGPGGAGQGSATADTAAVQAAFAAGGKFTMLGSQPILLNSPIVATKWIDVEGSPGLAPIVLTSLFPAASDVVTVRKAAGQPSVNWRIYGLKVMPGVAGRGRDGIVIDGTVSADMSRFVVERCQVGDVVGTANGFVTVSGVGLRYIPNATAADQLYCSEIRNNKFVGGINMRKAGDSLSFTNNWVQGRNRAFDVEFISGAAGALFLANNCVASGGAYYLKNAFRSRIDTGQIELLTAWTGDGNQALVVLENCDGVVLDGTNLNADLGDGSAALTADCISLLGTTTRTRIVDNRLVCNEAAGRVHLRTAAGVTKTTFEGGQRIEGAFLVEREAPVTSIATPGSVAGIWFPLTLANGWTPQVTGGSTNEGLSYKILPGGGVRLRGNVSPAAGAISANTQVVAAGGFPAGARTAGKVIRIFPKYANGSGYASVGMQITSSGAMTLAYDLPGLGPVSFDDVSYDPTSA